MNENLRRAQRLAEEAQVNYAALKRDSESRVVRWEWATFEMYSFEPAHFEIAKVKKGKLLKSEPKSPVSGVHGYGFDADGRVVVERQQTEFAGREYETFFRHEADGIERFHFTYDPKKEWINVGWLSRGPNGIASVHSVYKRGNWIETSYAYDASGRVCGCERRGTNPPYGDLHDFRDIEYDPAGNVVRVWWRYPDGRRLIDFERPEKAATLRSCRKSLTEELTKAVVEGVGRLANGEEVFAVVFSHCGAQYQHRLPPDVSVGTNTTLRRMLAAGADVPNFVWNPAEWGTGGLSLNLAPNVAALCGSVSQDVWQNDLQSDADVFLRDLARKITLEKIPAKLASTFVSVVVDLDMGDYGTQVEGQLDRRTVKALRANGML